MEWMEEVRQTNAAVPLALAEEFSAPLPTGPEVEPGIVPVVLHTVPGELVHVTVPPRAPIWVGPVATPCSSVTGCQLPRYLGTRVSARHETTPAVCTGEGSHGHTFNEHTSIECLPGTCFNNHISTQNFPVTVTMPLRIHGTGLFTSVAIRSGTPVIECAGDVINYPTYMRSMGLKVRLADLSSLSFWKLSTVPKLTINACDEHTTAIYANH